MCKTLGCPIQFADRVMTKHFIDWKDVLKVSWLMNVLSVSYVTMVPKRHFKIKLPL